MIDGLTARGRLVEIDWKEPRPGVLEALDQLLGQDSEDWAAVAPEDPEYLTGYELLGNLADHLRRKGIALEPH